MCECGLCVCESVCVYLYGCVFECMFFVLVCVCLCVSVLCVFVCVCLCLWSM